jgi:predicted transcriptional regulator
MKTPAIEALNIFLAPTRFRHSNPKVQELWDREAEVNVRRDALVDRRDRFEKRTNQILERMADRIESLDAEATRLGDEAWAIIEAERAHFAKPQEVN